MFVIVLVCTFLALINIERPFFLLIFSFYVLHLGFLYLDSCYGISASYSKDVTNFYNNAQLLASNQAVTSQMSFAAYAHTVFMSYLFSFSLKGTEFITGALSSILAWILSCTVLINICRELKMSDNWIVVVLFILNLNIYDLMLTTTLLREPYQVLFIMSSIYYSLKIISNYSFRNFSLYILMALLSGIMHGTLFFTQFIIGSMAFILKIYNRLIKQLIILLGAIVFCLFLFGLFDHYIYYAYDFIHNRFINARYANTNYNPFISNYYGINIFLSWVYYMFYPFTLSTQSTTNIILPIMSMIRLLFLILSFISIILVHDPVIKKKMLLLLFSFLVITFIFSMGTMNYGTALRHHILSFWIIVVLGVKLLSLHRKIKKKNIPGGSKLDRLNNELRN